MCRQWCAQCGNMVSHVHPVCARIQSFIYVRALCRSCSRFSPLSKGFMCSWNVCLLDGVQLKTLLWISSGLRCLQLGRVNTIFATVHDESTERENRLLLSTRHWKIRWEKITGETWAQEVSLSDFTFPDKTRIWQDSFQTQAYSVWLSFNVCFF